MGVFSTNAVTDKGRILLAESQVGSLFIPTKIVMGSGSMPSGATPRAMTAIVTPVIQLDINKKRTSEDGKVIIGGSFSNGNVSSSFYFRELGLYAKVKHPDGSFSEEVLYAYGNAGASADLIPAPPAAVIEKQIDLVTWIGSDTQIDLTIESGAYIPFTDKGVPGGVAALGEDGLILPEQLPEMSTLLRAWPVLTTAGWAGSTGAWSQTVAVAGIKATDVAHVYPACSTTDAELAGRQRAAYNTLEPYVDSAEGTLTAYCKQSAAPTVDVPILVEVMR